MAWEMDNDRPIYAQLVERIQMQIVSGQYPPGEKLPSVRELAEAAAVNPNTMQRAFAELERSGLIVTQRTNGRNVTEDAERIRHIRSDLAREQMDGFFARMQELGYTRAETLELLNGWQPASDGREPEERQPAADGREPDGGFQSGLECGAD